MQQKFDQYGILLTHKEVKLGEKLKKGDEFSADDGNTWRKTDDININRTFLNKMIRIRRKLK